MQSIPDPVELIDSQMDRLEAQVVDDKIPCCYCGAMWPVDSMMPISPSPTALGMCPDCCDAENQRNYERSA